MLLRCNECRGAGMSASIRIKDNAEPITEDDLLALLTDDNVPTAFTWLDEPANPAATAPAEDETDFVDIDMNLEADNIPTLRDVYESTVVLSERGDDDDGDSHAELHVELAFNEPREYVPEAQPPVSVFSGLDPEPSVTVEQLDFDHHEEVEAQLELEAETQAAASVDNEGLEAAYHDAENQLPVHSMETLFNLSSYEPVQLQRLVMAGASVFHLIAAAALWRVIGDKVVATELVPPMVYASIGIVAYLLGMRYLRIHFAQVRVGDKDWLLCEQVMVAAENGVMLKARFGTAYLVWEQLLGVAHDNDYYYLLIEPTQGFKVPKQGVSDPLLQVKLDDMSSLTKAKAWQY
jgi:YcxB-like protein